MSSFNQVILFGRLGNDPEAKYTQGGACVVSLSIATSRRVKNRQTEEWDEVTSWHRCKAFGRSAEILAEHARKGDPLFIEGRLDYWEAEGARGKLQVAEVVVEHFAFAGGRRDGGGRGDRGPAPRGSTPNQPARGAQRGPTSRGRQPVDQGGEPGGGGFAPDFIDDDIPF